MKNEEYRAIKAINASFLKACSFGHYQGWKHLNQPAYESDAMAFGSAVHCALLEPHLFLSQYAISEKFDKRTKVGKEGAAAFESANIGKTVIDSDDATKIELIRKRCNEIEPVRAALASFEKEKTILFEGDKCKARLDLVDLKNGVVIDVKTTRDANPREFVNQLLALRYDIQLYHYCRAANATTAYAIAIESESAEVALYDLTDIVFSDFTKGRYHNAFAVALDVQKMTTCPPKFKTEIVNLNLPEWALKETV
jgi:hypothetical protein